MIENWLLFFSLGLLAIVVIGGLAENFLKLRAKYYEVRLPKEKALESELARVRREKEERELALQREIEEIKKKNQTKQFRLEDDSSTPIF
jgi:23S rRNA pseudoU1915 N3-methylase RlmH